LNITEEKNARFFVCKRTGFAHLGLEVDSTYLKSFLG